LIPRHSLYSLMMYDSILLVMISRTSSLLTKRQLSAWLLPECCACHVCFLCACRFWCQDLSDKPRASPSRCYRGGGT
jgi:hypothetical protein